jgi:hypothetical protein
MDSYILDILLVLVLTCVVSIHVHNVYIYTPTHVVQLWAFCNNILIKYILSSILCSHNIRLMVLL